MAEFLIAILFVLLAWFSHRYAWWRPTVPYRYPRILMYHMVAPRKPGAQFNGMRVAPQAFTAQVQWLKSNGWTFVSMSDLVSNWGKHADKTVAITFDDGFEDNFTAALPILADAEANATLYLVDQRQNNDWSRKKKRHHGSGELLRESKLSDAQVTSMLDSGRIELASHTLSHANLAQSTTDEKATEIVESKATLESNFDHPISSFAYPFGIYDEYDVSLVRQAGYSNAVTTDPGIDQIGQPDFFKLKRIKVSGKEGLWAFRLRLRTGHRGWKK